MNIARIKVGLATAPELELEINGHYFIEDSLRSITGSWRIYPNQDKIYIENEDEIIIERSFIELIPIEIDKADFRLKASNSPGLDDLKFNDRILIYRDEQNQICIVNQVSKRYLLRSLLTELYDRKAEPAYLKALAIVLRTIIQYKTAGTNKTSIVQREFDNQPLDCEFQKPNKNFDFHRCGRHFIYTGIPDFIPQEIDNAIESTTDKLLKYDGEICNATFSKCCGGYTESYENTWEINKYSYLTKRKDYTLAQDFDLTKDNEFALWISKDPLNLFDKKYSFVKEDPDQDHYYPYLFSNYRWQKEITSRQMVKNISKYIGEVIGSINAIQILERGYSGRVKKIRVSTDTRDYIIGKGNEIRKILSNDKLPSSAFIISEVKNSIGQIDRFVFTGAGEGHGVGLCLNGAKSMASQNIGEDVILAHYFPGASITNDY